MKSRRNDGDEDRYQYFEYLRVPQDVTYVYDLLTKQSQALTHKYPYVFINGLSLLRQQGSQNPQQDFSAQDIRWLTYYLELAALQKVPPNSTNVAGHTGFGVDVYKDYSNFLQETASLFAPVEINESRQLLKKGHLTLVASNS